MSKSKISVEPTELADGDEGAVAEIGIFLDREDETEAGMAEQLLLLTPAEYEHLYKQMILQHEQGVWSSGSVER